MSRVNISAIGLLMLFGCDQRMGPRETSFPSAGPEFNWDLHHLSDGVPQTLTARAGQLRLEFAGDQLKIKDTSGNSIDLDLIPPASILWRPDGRAVAINDGNGSGQITNLLIISDDPALSKREGVAEQLKSYFLHETQCRIESDNISVSAHGWSVDNSRILVKFESWDRDNFCDSESVYFAEYDFSRQKVVAHLSEQKTMAKFCPDSGFREQFGPNCLQYENRDSPRP